GANLRAGSAVVGFHLITSFIMYSIAVTRVMVNATVTVPTTTIDNTVVIALTQRPGAEPCSAWRSGLEQAYLALEQVWSALKQVLEQLSSAWPQPSAACRCCRACAGI